jgi:hypothetical protein
VVDPKRSGNKTRPLEDARLANENYQFEGITTQSTPEPLVHQPLPPQPSMPSRDFVQPPMRPMPLGPPPSFMGPLPSGFGPVPPLKRKGLTPLASGLIFGGAGLLVGLLLGGGCCHRHGIRRIRRSPQSNPIRSGDL